MILPFAAGASRIGESAAVAASTSDELPVAVFMGERILVCSVPAGQAHEMFDVRNEVRHGPDSTKAPDASSPFRKPKVRDAFGFNTSPRAS